MIKMKNGLSTSNNAFQLYNGIDFIPASVEQYQKETTTFHRGNTRVAAHKTEIVKLQGIERAMQHMPTNRDKCRIIAAIAQYHAFARRV
jgi:hypothetical protein